MESPIQPHEVEFLGSVVRVDGLARVQVSDVVIIHLHCCEGRGQYECMSVGWSKGSGKQTNNTFSI